MCVGFQALRCHALTLMVDMVGSASNCLGDMQTEHTWFIGRVGLVNWYLTISELQAWTATPCWMRLLERCGWVLSMVRVWLGSIHDKGSPTPTLCDISVTVSTLHP